MKAKHLKFEDEEIKNLPINYRYFEYVDSIENTVDLIKTVKRENIFLTSKKIIRVFYKPISKITT